MIDLTSTLPEMKSGQELISALSIVPEYDESIRKANHPTRLLALSDLYRIYFPSSMSVDIYNKLYLALFHSMQKKNSQMAIKQRYENYKRINGQLYTSILGGSDAFTIIGTSGIGKSSAISRAVALLSEKEIIETENPYTKIIPVLVVQCPFDASVKSLLLEILRKIDDMFGTDYYIHSVKARKSTTDVLIGEVSSIAINHVGMLIVDEIQNVVNSKNGRNLIGALTQLINNSGISICMVGTPESAIFFESAMQLARRSIGLRYSIMQYDNYFQNFCRFIFQYQYVQHKTSITPAITEWLYEHSAGIISIVVVLIHDAQEIAIVNGIEELNLYTLNEAYKQRLDLLHSYIQPSIKQINSTSIKSTRQKEVKEGNSKFVNRKQQCEFSIEEIIKFAKDKDLNAVDILKDFYTVNEVRI